MGFRSTDKVLTAMRSAVTWLEENDFPYAVVGGTAASHWGRPRSTEDIDFMAKVPEQQWEIAQRQVKRFGLKIVDNDEATAHEFRIVRLSHRGRPIDLVFVGTGFEYDILRRAVRRQIYGVSCKVIDPTDLMICKIMTARPRDIADCEGLLDAGVPLDWERIDALLGRWCEDLNHAKSKMYWDALKKHNKDGD